MMEVLLVEDNRADQILAEKAFEELDTPCKLTVVDDGEQAMDYLYETNFLEGGNRPNLIVLDLNMPKMSGHEVLNAVKSNPELANIPIVMLTSSRDLGDIKKCYANHANSYLHKSTDMEEFTESIRDLEHYWFNVVDLP